MAPVVAEKTKVFATDHNIFTFINKLSLQLEALSNFDNFNVIVIVQ